MGVSDSFQDEPTKGTGDGDTDSTPSSRPTARCSCAPYQRHKPERAHQSPNSDEERIRLRTAALAEKLELSAGDEEALLAVFLEEQTRRAAAFRGLRGTTNQPAVRTELNDILAWKREELRSRFGSELAKTMMRR